MPSAERLVNMSTRARRYTTQAHVLACLQVVFHSASCQRTALLHRQKSRSTLYLTLFDVDYRLFALGKGAVTLDSSIEAAKGVYPDLALQGRDVASGPSPFEPADFVVANILGPLLIAFADEIAGYAKKTLVVSGILEELYPEVLAAFQSRGFQEVSHKTIGEWTTGCLCRA